MNQRSERPKMSATVVAEGGPCSCQRRWVLKCASHMVTFNKLLWKEWQRRKRGTEGRREGGKEKWMPPNLPSLTFSLLLSWRSFSSAFPRGSYYKAVVLSCKHFIAQIQNPGIEKLQWTWDSQVKAPNGHYLLFLGSNATFFRYLCFPS